MSNSKETLDDFLTQNSEKKEDKVTGKLEDEFAKLLNDFINQSTEEVPPQKNSASNQTTTVVESGLESFVTPSENKINNSQMESGLESFITSSENKNAPQLENSLDGFIAQSGGGLDSFITPQVSGTSADGMNSSTSTIQAEAENTNISSELSSLQTLTIEKNQVAEEEKSKLKNEEKELARAVTNFKDGVIALAEKKNLKVPETDMLDPSEIIGVQFTAFLHLLQIRLQKNIGEPARRTVGVHIDRRTQIDRKETVVVARIHDHRGPGLLHLAEAANPDRLLPRRIQRRK